MKKKLISYILAGACILGAAGCTSNPTTSTSENSSVETKTENVMLSFDNYSELLSVLMLSAPFGGTDFCSDQNYVVEGESSLRVAPEGEYGTINTFPTMTIYTDGKSFYEGDFSSLENISFYVYNANDVELHLQLALNAQDNQVTARYAPTKQYTLMPNSWNKVVYDFSDGALRKSLNDLKIVNFLQISFMEYKQNKTDEPYIYYFDCLQGQKSEKEFSQYQANLGDNQIYNFEKLEDKYSVLCESTNKEAYFLPKTSICTDKVFTTEGTKSLKVEYPCVRNDRVRSYGNIYTYLYFDMSYTLIPDDAEAVSVDVINANDFTVIISVTGCDELGNLTTTKEVLMQPNTMQTFTVNVAALSYLRLNFTNRIEPVYSVLYVDNIQFH